MKSHGHLLSSFFASILCIAFVGCNGSGPATPIVAPEVPPYEVIFSPAPPATLAVNASTSISATAVSSVVTSTSNPLVTYSLSCGSPNACGTFSSNNQLGATTYTAPPAVPSGGNVIITATSVAVPSLSATATITITPPVPIKVSFFSPVPASLEQGTTTQLSAIIDNDISSNPMVKWSLSCPDTDCGSFSSTETANQSPTTYTAPAAIPSGGSVTVTATSVTDATKSASATIVILPPSSQLADGTYVFQISGPVLNGNTSFTGFGTTMTTGVFIASHGKIVGGEQDSILNAGGMTSMSSQIVGGSYGPMSDGNIGITLDPLDNPTEILTGTMATGSQGFVAGVQGIVGMGTLELQTSTAAPSGAYAFLLAAATNFDASPTVAGILNVDGATTLSGRGSVFDVKQRSGQSGTVQLTQSQVSQPDSYGRVLFNLQFVPNAVLGDSTQVAGYIVDSTRMRLIVAGEASNNYYAFGDVGGLALNQGATAGTFSSASVAGSTYVFAAEGADQQSALQIAGTCTFNADGSATGVLNWNDRSGGTAQSPQAFKGTYTVDPTGRVTLSNLTDGANFNYSLHLELDGHGGGLVLSNDANDRFTGQAFEQQTATFSAASLSGRFGISAGLFLNVSNSTLAFPMLTGWFTSTPAGSSVGLSGYADLGNGGYDFALTGTFAAASNGVFQGQINGLNGVLTSTTQSASPSPNSFTLYMIDNTQGVLIETDNTQLLLGRLQLAQQRSGPLLNGEVDASARPRLRSFGSCKVHDAPSSHAVSAGSTAVCICSSGARGRIFSKSCGDRTTGGAQQLSSLPRVFLSGDSSHSRHSVLALFPWEG